MKFSAKEDAVCSGKLFLRLSFILATPCMRAKRMLGLIWDRLQLVRAACCLDKQRVITSKRVGAACNKMMLRCPVDSNEKREGGKCAQIQGKRMP